jgi:hypothetical protein
MSTHEGAARGRRSGVFRGGGRSAAWARRVAALAALSAVACLPAGCSTFSETHFFKSEGEEANYYRLRVRGNTGLGSARYLSGYFDEEAVNEYFNETSQPAAARFSTTRPAAAENAEGDAEGGEERVRPLGASPDDNRILVMLLSSNSDAVADQIGAFAQNREIATMLGGLLTRGQVAAQRRAARELAVEKTRAATIATLGDAMVEKLTAAEALAAGGDGGAGADPAKAAADASAAALFFVNRAAAELGHTGTFATLDEANTWLRDNRGRLLAE